uniref:Uncharacterized protein n=1 Tax=Euplotes harpa TaxID=151035 RepID=A0A7S3JA15_9SPIT
MAWHYVGVGSFGTGLLFGMIGRKRIYFSNRQQYNKYHFGVFCQFLSGFGFILTRKTKNPMHAGAFFISGTLCNSLLAYYEGYRDHREYAPLEYDTATVRLFGFYSILSGFALLTLRSAGYMIF